MLATISLLATIIANSILGIVIFSRAPREKSNQKFALLSLAIVGWIGTLFIYYAVSSLPVVLFIGRLNFFIAALIPLAIFQFILAFPKKIVIFPKWFELSVAFYSFSMAFFTMTPFIDTNETISHGQHYVIYGILYIPYLLSLISISVICIVTLIRKMYKAPLLIRTQLQYLLLGFTSLVIIAIFFNGILPFFFKITAFDPFGPLATIVFLGFISYAMLKHRFMDINRIAAGTAVYTISIAGMGIFFFTIAFFIGRAFFPNIVNIQYIFVTVAFCLGLQYAISPVRRYFWQFTNMFFYSRLYNREELFDAVSRVVLSSIHLRTLVNNILEALCFNYLVQYVAFIRIEDETLQDVQSHGARKYQLQFSPQEIAELKKITHITYVEDLGNKKLQRLLEQKHIYLIAPLPLEQDSQGIFFFGEKISGATYSQYDIATIKQILPMILITLQNAMHVEEIERFNAGLKKEIHKATKELLRVNEQLRYSDKLKDEFISIASHELKTPTTAIQGFLWLVLHKDKALSSYSKDKIEKVSKLTSHLTALVNDMLDVSKIESKKILLQPEKFDIGELVYEIKDEFDFFAIQKKMQIRVKDGKMYQVWADKQRVHQIVSNLMNNALKYTPAGGRIAVTFAKKDQKVEVSVKDTGIGIRQEDKYKLFTKFGKLDDGNSLSSHLPGTGLGLYITKHFVELSGGEIGVESTYGKGSVFTFSLPLDK